MEIPRHWRLKAQRYRLEGSACSNCGQPIFPPRPVCSFCTAKQEISVLLPLPTLTEVEVQIGNRIIERLIT